MTYSELVHDLLITHLSRLLLHHLFMTCSLLLLTVFFILFSWLFRDLLNSRLVQKSIKLERLVVIHIDFNENNKELPQLLKLLYMNLFYYDLFMFCSQPVHTLIMTCSWVVNYLSTTCLWLAYNLFMNFSLLVYYFFISFS